jgi:hypothetical protein
MFTDRDDNLLQFNLNKYNDLKRLECLEYITVPEDTWDNIHNRCANTEKNFIKDEISIDELQNLLIRSFNTEELMSLISSFPPEYSIFKILDYSCANLYKEGNFLLSPEEKSKVFARYGSDMKSCRPEKVRGGKRKKPKTRRRKRNQNKFKKSRRKSKVN